MTNVAFDAFSCYTFDAGKWLQADVSIKCGSANHHSVIIVAVVAIVLYPVGLLIINASLLFAARRAIRTGKHTPLSRSIAFLYREYKPHMYAWECVEMLRRFVLVGLMILAQGSIMQIIVGILIAAIFFLLQLQSNPYVDTSDDFLAAATSFSLVIVFVCATCFKYLALTDLRDLQLKMSTEQKDVYIISATTLVFITLACVFGAIVLSVILFVIQVNQERDRLRREARANKARRLRHKTDNKEVQLPNIAADEFHLFLSHVGHTLQHGP